MDPSPDTSSIPRSSSLALFEPADDWPSKPRMIRGIKIARQVEEASGLLHRARRHAKWSRNKPARKKTRRHLAKLRDELDLCQRRVLELGISSEEWGTLRRDLSTFCEALLLFVNRAPKKHRLKALRNAGKRLSRALGALSL